MLDESDDGHVNRDDPRNYDKAQQTPAGAPGIEIKVETMNNETTGAKPLGTEQSLGGEALSGNETGAHRTEAKSRFTAAVSEAKAGVAALKAEATEKAGAYRQQAGERSQDLLSDAKSYGSEAKVKGRDLAQQGKGKVTKGLSALGQTLSENAYVVDEKLGAKYGDYARSASRSIQDAATKLDGKSIDEIGEDARTFVRQSPGTAVGIAAVVGFLLSRLFTGSRR